MVKKKKTRVMLSRLHYEKFHKGVRWKFFSCSEHIHNDAVLWQQCYDIIWEKVKLLHVGQWKKIQYTHAPTQPSFWRQPAINFTLFLIYSLGIFLFFFFIFLTHNKLQGQNYPKLKKWIYKEGINFPMRYTHCLYFMNLWGFKI